MLAGKSVEGWGVNVKRTTAVAGIAYRKCMCVTAHSGRRLVQAAGPKATAPDAQLSACRGGTEEWAIVRRFASMLVHPASHALLAAILARLDAPQSCRGRDGHVYRRRRQHMAPSCR